MDKPEAVGEGQEESVGDWRFPSTSWSGRGAVEIEGLAGAGEFIATLGVLNVKRASGVVVNWQVRKVE